MVANNTLTGIKDTDVEILNYLDDRDIVKLSMTCKDAIQYYVNYEYRDSLNKPKSPILLNNSYQALYLQYSYENWLYCLQDFKNIEDRNDIIYVYHDYHPWELTRIFCILKNKKKLFVSISFDDSLPVGKPIITYDGKKYTKC